MSSLNSTADAFVRPEYFIIRGFSNIPYVNYYYIFLFMCYAVAVLGNLFVMTIIYVVLSLHTPKYMAVFNLAVSDLGESTALIPNLVETFLFTTQKISYEACMANMFFVLFFFCMQSMILTIFAYDRFVAICFPLRYHSIVTNTSMAIIITVLWVFDLLIVIIMVSATTRLSFCRSVVVTSYFCNYGPIYVLACNDNSLNKTIGLICTVMFYFIPLILIGLSYASILLVLFKIATWEERIKALKTCTSHFISVSVFYVPLVIIDMATLSSSLNSNARIIGISLSSTIPPALNPIVYSLNTAEIKDFVRKMLKGKRHKDVVAAIVE